MYKYKDNNIVYKIERKLSSKHQQKDACCIIKNLNYYRKKEIDQVEMF